MKTRLCRWLVAAALAFLAGCATDSRRTSPPQANRPLRLAFITCARDARFFEPVKQGMNDAARMLDVRCDWLGTPGVDVKAQAELVRQAVAKGYHGLAVNLIDPVAFDAAVEEAIKAGVPVVSFNVDDHATPNVRLAAVNQRLYEAGRTLGQHVAPAIPAGSHVLLTMHDEGVSALEDRRRGIQDAIQEKGVKWTVVVSGNDSAKGAEVIADALRQHPDIRVVLSTGQSDTEAAGLAIEKHFPNQGYWSAGFDLSDATLRLIQAGHIRCTIDQQPYVQGFYPVVMLTQYLRYGLKPSSVDAGAAVIDRSNAAQVLELTRQHYR
jgi:simple sugar transport system substrate-binding protein